MGAVVVLACLERDGAGDGDAEAGRKMHLVGMIVVCGLMCAWDKSVEVC